MKPSSETKASNSSQTEAGPRPIKLVVKGLGHIPAIKNSMYSIVDPRNREWKRRCVQDFVLQLLSTIPIIEQGTPMPPCLASLIASLPQDDSWQDIPEISLACQKVEKGMEGALITITPL